TPGARDASEISMLRISACACSLRRMAMWTMPGSCTSSINFASPRRISGSSRRLSGAPSILLINPLLLVDHPREVVDDLLIAQIIGVEHPRHATVGAHGGLVEVAALRLGELVGREHFFKLDPFE